MNSQQHMSRVKGSDTWPTGESLQHLAGAKADSTSSDSEGKAKPGSVSTESVGKSKPDSSSYESGAKPGRPLTSMPSAISAL